MPQCRQDPLQLKVVLGKELWWAKPKTCARAVVGLCSDKPVEVGRVPVRELTERSGISPSTMMTPSLVHRIPNSRDGYYSAGELVSELAERMSGAVAELNPAFPPSGHWVS